MEAVLNFIKENWLWLAPVLWEIIARIWPTKWDLSILDLIKRIVDMIIINKRVPDGKEVLVPGDSSKNLIKVDVNKHI